MKNRDLLGGKVDKGTHFFATLVGVKTALSRFLDVPDFPIVHNNDKKLYLRKNPQEEQKYPYAYASISSIGLIEERQNAKTVRRHGLAHNINGTNASVDKYYIFPVKFSLDFHYIVDDFADASKFILKALVLLGTEAMNFRLRTGGKDSLPWTVRIVMESKEIQFPLADKDLESDPEGHDITLSFVIETYHGVVRQTAKINNEGKVHVGAHVAPIPKDGEEQSLGKFVINDDGSVGDDPEE